MGTCGGRVAAAGFLLRADLPHGPSKRMLCLRAQHSVSQHTVNPGGFTPHFPEKEPVLLGHSAKGLWRGLVGG